MLTYKNGWQLYPHKVYYTQNSEPHEQYALPDKQWWTEFADKWSHTIIDKFEEIPVTDDMQKRCEEIRNMPEDFGDLYTEYVLTGDTGEREIPAGHPFNIVRLRREQKEQDGVLVDLEYRQSLTEMGM